MFPKLNKSQKLLLAIVGIIITIVQLYKFSEDGVEGGSWVLAFIVSTLMVLPSLSIFRSKTGVQDASSEYPERKLNHSKPVDAGQRKFNEFLDSSARVKVAFDRIQRSADELKNMLVECAELPEAPTMASESESMIEDWGRSSYVYVAALSAAAEYIKKQEFIESPQFPVYVAQVVREMLRSSRKSAEKEGLLEMHDDDRVKNLLTKDFDLSQLAMKQFLSNIALKKNLPEEPLLNFLFVRIGATGVVKDRMEVPVREFTKRVLREFSL